MVSTVTARLLITCVYLAVSPSTLIMSTDATLTPVPGDTPPAKPELSEGAPIITDVPKVHSITSEISIASRPPAKPKTLPENLRDMVLSACKNRFGVTFVTESEIVRMLKGITAILGTLREDIGEANGLCKTILKIIAKLYPEYVKDALAEDMSGSVERRLKSFSTEPKQEILKIYGANPKSSWAEKLVTAQLSDATFIMAVLPGNVIRLFEQAKLPVPDSTLARIKDMAKLISSNGSKEAYTKFCEGVGYITSPSYYQTLAKTTKFVASKSAAYVKSGPENVVLETDIPLFAEVKQEFGTIIIPERFVDIEAFIQTIKVLEDVGLNGSGKVKEKPELADICKIQFSDGDVKAKLEFGNKITKLLQEVEGFKRVTTEFVVDIGPDNTMELAASFISADVLAYAKTIRLQDVEEFIDSIGRMDNWQMIKLTCTVVTVFVAKATLTNPVASANLGLEVAHLLATQLKNVARNAIGNQILASGNRLADWVEKGGQDGKPLAIEGTTADIPIANIKTLGNSGGEILT